MRTLFITNVGSHMWGMDTPESDVDLFVVKIANSRDILLGKTFRSEQRTEWVTKGEVPGWDWGLDFGVSGLPWKTGDRLLVDRALHEVGTMVHQLIKNNWNFLVGVMSPNLLFPKGNVGDMEGYMNLRAIVMTHILSKECYHSIHGLAFHNYRKYIQKEKDYGQKRLDTIGRTLIMGRRLLQGDGFMFEPITGTTKYLIEKWMADLDDALKTSPLPDHPPNPGALWNWLLDLRLEDLKA